MGRVGEEKRKERRSERRKSEKTEDAGARKGTVGKSRCIVFFFQGFVAPEGRKVGLLKRRVRSHPAR